MRSEGKLDYLEMQAGGGAIRQHEGVLQRRLRLELSSDYGAFLFRIRGGSRWRLRRFGAEGHEAAAGALFGEPGRHGQSGRGGLGAGSSGRSSTSPAGGASTSSIRPETS